MRLADKNRTAWTDSPTFVDDVVECLCMQLFPNDVGECLTTMTNQGGDVGHVSEPRPSYHATTANEYGIVVCTMFD